MMLLNTTCSRCWSESNAWHGMILNKLTETVNNNGLNY